MTKLQKKDAAYPLFYGAPNKDDLAVVIHAVGVALNQLPWPEGATTRTPCVRIENDCVTAGFVDAEPLYRQELEPLEDLELAVTYQEKGYRLGSLPEHPTHQQWIALNALFRQVIGDAVAHHGKGW